MFTINQNLIDDFADKINEKEKKNNKVTSWSSTTTDAHYPSEKLVKDSLDNHTHNSQISYGQVDSTSTSTVFTATVPNLTSLTDGTTVMLRNGVVTSASGFTLNVNNLGAKPVYNNMADATRDTTIFNINYTMLFVYDSTRVSDGCWICYRGYNSDTNTIAYQIRTNSQKMYATDKTYRYRLLLEVDDTNYMPVNLSTSTSADVSKTSTMNTREFKLGGNIIYYSSSTAVNQNGQFANPYLWKQYTFSLGFSFNNTNTALELTQWSPVYMVAEKSATNEGMAKLVSPYYTQSLPNSEDGKLYIFLGQAYNTTNIEIVLEHPIYEYKNGKIRLYRDYYTISETDTLLNGKANSSHTHTKSQITDFPTIPSKTSDLTNDGDGTNAFLTQHQSLTNCVQKSNTTGLLKNDGTVMESGTGASNFALGNHTHNYASSSHNHNDTYYTETEIDSLLEDKLDVSNAFTGSYNDLTDKPNSFTPSSHSHSISEVTNLQNSLNNKLESTDVGAVALSNDYDDLDNKPTIPTATSDLTNDSGFLTSHQSLDSKTVTVEEQSQAETGFTKTYIIKQGGVQVGNKINIPKDFLVKSASVKTVSTANNPVQGYVTGDKYLDFVVNSKDNTATDEHLYVLVSELVDTEIDWANVQNKPTFFDGNYNNLTNKPAIPTDVSDLTDTNNKQFTPKSHTHTKSQITDFAHNHNDLYYTETETDTLLNGKLDVEDAFTGSYDDLSNKPTIPTATSDLTNDSGFLTSHQDISGKEDKSNKVTSLSENSTNTQYPSAKTVYDELMNVRTVTPSIDNDGSKTLNNVTKNWCTSSIDSSDLEYFEKIVYNITFKDNDFQMFQYFTDYIIYFDGTDCYWGEWDENDNSVLNKGTLICEGNTIQATLNKYKTVTIGDTITDGDIRDEIRMFGNIDFTYTIYSHKYLDTDYPYTFEYHNFEKASMGDATTNSVTKEYGYIFLSKWDNLIEAIYTITFNDDDDSYLDFGYEATIYFDGTYCYWGVWDEHNNVIGLHRICEGNVVQATYLCNDDKIHFPDGNSISPMDNWTYFGDVKIKVRNKILVLEYASNKTYSIENSFNDAICYPSIATLKNYAETKINRVCNISSSSTHTQYPTAKCVYDNLNSVYDNFIFNENLTPYTHILSNYTNTSSATLSVANEVLTITGNGASNGDTGLLNTKVFAPITEDYIISFDIQKATGTYPGKDFDILIGDNNNYLLISPQYYVIRFIENGTEFNTVEAIQCDTYTNLAIQRINGNNWKFYMNNSLIHSFSTSSSEIPNQITFYGFHSNDVVNVKNVKITRKRIDSSNELVDMIYPVGSIYMSVNNVSPQYLFGGTWEQIKDTFLLAAGDTYANGSTGGSATVTLTSAQSGVPAHSHKYQDYNTTYTLKTTNRKPGTSTAVAYGTSLTAGGGATERTSSNNTAANASQAHENMPPYMAVYMWKRTA